jgi:exodeoxyribonuclease-3
MKIATFNAASIRARLPILLDWLAKHQPDVLAVQETKVEDDKFPVAEFESIGYKVSVHGQKAWNGVCFISKEPMSNVRCGFADPFFPSDCRVLAGEYQELHLINTYVPNGNQVGTDKWEYKMRWLDRFGQYLRQNYRSTQPVLWLGDINIAPTPLDVYEPAKKLGKVGHHPDEFKKLDAIKAFGLVDLYRQFHAEEPGYTFFDFIIPNSVQKNLGWRIDHLYATPLLAEKCVSCNVDMEPRLMERPSDHTFVIAEFAE